LSKSDSGLHGRIGGKPRGLPVTAAGRLDATDTHTDKRTKLREMRGPVQIRNSQTD
jgi:hypothetical protein